MNQDYSVCYYHYRCEVECFDVKTGIGYGSPGSDEYAFLTWEQQLEALVK